MTSPPSGLPATGPAVSSPPASPASPALPAPAPPGLPTLLSAAAFYALAFFALTWPAALHFRTHFFADEGDGLQNVWNIWWVEHAVGVLHQSPWQTSYLHYPYGTTLLGHTLNPFNGFVGIALSRFMEPVAVHNSVVISAFVVAGLTAFLLAHHLTRSVSASLLAGFIFTFSSFHFAHAEGHLQLVSLEWIPLFVLLWLKLLTKPRFGLGVGAAFVLWLVILCDYYYFVYCVMTGAIILAWWAARNEGVKALLLPQRVAALGAFAVVSLATSGLLAGSLLLANLRDPLAGAHDAAEFSMDLLAPAIYGGHWRFAELTSAYWKRLPGNIHESSVHLGLAVIVLAIYAWLQRRVLRAPEIALFAFLSLVFLVLALGPTPYLAGKAILGNLPVMPYAWLLTIFPPLALSGTPVRMMVMVMLSAAILAAYGFGQLTRGSGRDRRAAVALACLLVIESLPKAIPTTAIATPEYVTVLRDAPGHDGVVDAVSPPTHALLFQTIHHKPLAFGYLARLPGSVVGNDTKLTALLQSGRFDRLWPEYRIRYAVASDPAGTLSAWPGAVTLWTDGTNRVVDVAGLQPKDLQ